TVTTTPEDIAVDLGRDYSTMDTIERAQLQRWISDATFLINQRVTDDMIVDADALDYVIRQAVIAMVNAPKSGVESESVQIDDGMVTTRYKGAVRRVTILPEWWAMLGITEGRGNAFTVSMVPNGLWNH